MANHNGLWNRLLSVLLMHLLPIGRSRSRR